jgi:uncharacterized protein (TIGR02453 family)
VARHRTSLKQSPDADAKIVPQGINPCFSEDSLKFLRGLKRNNRRDWFDPRKPLFETVLKAPMLNVIEGVTAAMMDFSPEHVRPAAKCMMRIYRDTRFSRDKTPYKTRVAAWWSRHGLEKTSGWGFYFHLSAEELVIAAGVYMPERDQLMAIRTFLLDHHEELHSLLKDKGLVKLFALDHGELLSRPPKGFPKDHPAMDLLKCRQWAVFARLPVEQALSPQLVKAVSAHFRAAAPLVALLNQPLISAPKDKGQPLFGLYWRGPVLTGVRGPQSGKIEQKWP